MRTVANILSRKGSNVVRVAPESSVISALTIMAEKNIGSVVVMDNDHFLGIMTERDYSRKVVLMGRSSDHTQVSEIMSSDFPALSFTDTVAHCMQVMSANNLRYLPVFAAEKLSGIISMNDVVAETIIGQTEMITYLQNYIQS